MAKLSISGKFIEEISHNIPGTKYALVELIKNSYEAMANEVIVDISPSEIKITDDGTGMDLDEIDTLLTVSHSNKRFGQEIKGRLISGEKGLGFFSAFKFGNTIKVYTCKNNKEYSFKLNMDVIASQKSLNNLDIPIKEKNINTGHRGTQIVISEIYEETFNVFKDTIDTDSDFKRLLNVIDDPEFKIKINKSWETELKDEYNKSELERLCLATITFDSDKMLHCKNNKEEYYFILLRNGKEYLFPINDKFNQLLKKHNFSVKTNINIYNLKGFNVKKMPSIYLDSTEQKIGPLIYINNCYFENFNMYNTEINARRKNTDVFRQQTGKIKMEFRESGIVSFNSDRTQMTESTNSILIKEFLDYFSSNIQLFLREILEEEKESEPKKSKEYIFVGESSKLEKIVNGSVTIYMNDNKIEDIDTEKEGEYLIVLENGDKIELYIVERPDPTIIQTKNSFIVGREYKFDELFLFRDCEGGSKIKPLIFEVNPSISITINYKKRTIVFNSEIENIQFNIAIKDKITNKVKHGSYRGISKFQKIKAEDSRFSRKIISPLMNIKENVRPDILTFKYQLNELYNNIDEYELVFVSAIRTFVELIINDIADEIGIENAKELEKNYKEISKSENINEKFIYKINNERDRAGISAIYRQGLKDGRYDNTVQYLNLTTHLANRLIGIDQLKINFPIINLLYTYLCFLCE